MSFYAYTYRPYVFQNLYLIHWFNYFFHTKIIQHLYIGLQKYSHNLYIYTYTIHDILKLDAIYFFFFEKLMVLYFHKKIIHEYNHWITYKLKSMCPCRENSANETKKFLSIIIAVTSQLCLA